MIRAAEPRDAKDLARMGQAFFDSTPLKKIGQFDPSSLFKFVSIEDVAHTFVLEIDGNVVGASSVILFPLLFDNSKLIAQEAFWWIDPEHRKGFNGRKLHRKLEEWAKDNGAHALLMIAIEDETTEKVEKLYNHYGYEKLEHTFMKEL